MSGSVLLLGASGYVGRAFAAELRRRGCDYVPLSRHNLDYTRFDILFDHVRSAKPSFVINAAGFTGHPNLDSCETARQETLYANSILPQTVARVCLMRNIPWGHVSSGSIYSGAKLLENGETLVERDLNRPELRQLLPDLPPTIGGFTEKDEPNFSFLCPPCSFYAGSKALGEQAIKGVGHCYIWRPGVVFGPEDHPRNLLSKLQRYPKIYDHAASVSQLDDFASACLDLWETKAPYGIYNLANPGPVAIRQIVKLLQETIQPDRNFEFWTSDEEFYQYGARAPRPSYMLDTSKAHGAGIRLRSGKDAIEDSLKNWRWSLATLDFADVACRR